jgi:glycerophosphoryl diester phosphodiesterase
VDTWGSLRLRDQPLPRMAQPRLSTGAQGTYLGTALSTHVRAFPSPQFQALVLLRLFRTSVSLELEIIAHRGMPRELPENSLPGFARALELGADGIELDVHLTADGVLVVHHDAVLTGPNNQIDTRRPRIDELTWDALSDFPIAYGVPIPRLTDVLGLVGPRATVYVEVKAAGAEAEAARCICAGGARCAVHGFDHRVSLRTATIAPQLPTGILLDSYLVDPVAALRAARARDYWQRWEFIDADLVASIHGAGGRVIAWTVNDASEAASLREMGVDAVCTDDCRALRRALLTR